MDKLQALGREIRYVEYKLRRQQQEKKKKKQAQRDFVNASNDQPYGDLSNNNVQAKEINFESEFAKSVANSVGAPTVATPKSELEKARPANEQEEQLQLELALAMSRDAADTVSSPKPAATGSLLDVTSPAPAAVSNSNQATFDPWGCAPTSSVTSPAAASPAVTVTAPSQAAWDPFGAQPAQPPAQQVVNPPVNQSVDPFGGGNFGATPVSATTASTPAPAASWTAFGNSGADPFANPANQNAPVSQAPVSQTPTNDSLFDLPPSQPTEIMQPAKQAADLLSPTPSGGDLLSPQSSVADQAKMRKTPTDFLGTGANLVNFDNLVSKPASASSSNPFMSSGVGVKKTNPFQKQSPGTSLNSMAAKSNTTGFDGFNGGGMAPLMPTTSAQPANHMTPKPAMTSQPVFSSQPSNLMFGVQPMSLSQNNQRQNNSNPFNF